MPHVPRILLSPAQIRSKLGITPTPDVREVTARDEAGPGLFCSYIVEQPAPDRHRILYVFPYADPAWEVRIGQLLDFEERAWMAFWLWVAKHQTPRGRVMHVVPLIQPVEDAVFRPRLHIDGQVLPALIRPMMTWPSREYAPGKVEAARILAGDDDWVGLEALLRVVWSEAGERLETLDLTRVGKLRAWHLLSDGRRCVPTQFRLFHKDHYPLFPS